jgi:hypothetical protein
MGLPSVEEQARYEAMREPDLTFARRACEEQLQELETRLGYVRRQLDAIHAVEANRSRPMTS